jgi:hypothetical protein
MLQTAFAQVLPASLLFVSCRSHHLFGTIWPNQPRVSKLDIRVSYDCRFVAFVRRNIMIGSLARRSTIFTVLIGFVFSVGCRAARKPIPAPTTDASLAR